MRRLSRPWLVVSAIGLSLTLQNSDGFFHEPTLVWLGLSLVAALLGLAGVQWPWPAEDDDHDGRATRWLLVAGVLASVGALFSRPLARYMADPRPWAHPELLVAAVLAGAVATVVRPAHGAPAWRRATFVVAAVGLWIGVWTIRESPTPHIDVIPVHAEAFASLARGESPYAITFKNIYAVNEDFYAPGMRDGQKVLFGFPYPPLSLLLAWPGYALLGDLRYSEVLALVIAAVLIIRMGHGVGLLCAAALVLAPRLVFHLEQGWTEPFPIVLLTVTVATALRRPSLAWLPLGLLIASKQHMLLALLFAPMLPTRGQGSHKAAVASVSKAIAVAVAVTLPLALLDFDAFWQSAVLLQLREPFRLDSLSFARELLLFGVPLDKEGALALSLSAGLLGICLAWWRAPRTPAGFAASLAVTCFLLTAFGKKAFLNYYFLVVAFLLVAVAASSRPPGRQEPSSPAHPG